MTSFKKTMALAIALPLALGSASALAYGGGKLHGGKGFCGAGPEGRNGLYELELTVDQQKQLKALREANREAMQANRGERRAAMQEEHQQMQSLLLAENFDEQAVRALAQKMSEQQLERRVAMLKNRHEMLKILTPEQKTKLQELQAKRAERCEARRAAKTQ